jgi:hypothetical protein
LHKGGWNVQNWQLLLKLILINLALPIRRSELMLRF